jgi:probable HAF family extracellular repeat protein
MRLSLFGNQRLNVLAMSVLCLVGCVRSAFPATIIDLGTLGGSQSYAEGLNASGQVVGYSLLPGDAVRHAFVYSNGVMTDLGTLGGTNSSAWGINASGQIVGYSDTAGNGTQHGFSYAGGVLTDLGTLGGYSSAFGINDYGQIAGDSGAGAFLFSGGIMTGAGNLALADAINARGEVVGTSPINNGYYPSSYMGGVTTDLGSLGGDTGLALGLNNSGQIVGYSNTVGDQQQHAFLYSAVGIIDLGTLGGSASQAYGINDSGQIVGNSWLSPNTCCDAFLYSNGSMIDLNSLLPAGSDFSAPGSYEGALAFATAINNSGQIVGTGFVNGQPHAFLLDLSDNNSGGVTPEPSAGALLAGSLIALGLRRRNSKRRAAEE